MKTYAHEQFSFVESFSLAGLVLWILRHFTRHRFCWQGKERVVAKGSVWRSAGGCKIHLGIVLVTWLGAADYT